MDNKILFGFILGLISSAFGAWLAHRLSEKRRKKESFNSVATEFRNAFLPEVVYLKHNAKINGASSEDDLHRFLHSAYRRHLEAFEQFKNHLSQREIENINSAWYEYCYHHQNPHFPFFEQYSWKATGKGKNKEQELKNLALHRIEKILSFAEPK